LPSEIKWIIGAVLALILIFGGYKLYNLGYEAAMASVDHDNKIATDAAVNAARTEWQSSQTITQSGMQNVQDTKQKIVYITQKAQTIVAPKCSDVGAGFAGVYNQYIDTIQGNPDPSGREFDGKVSDQVANENAGANR
jgi:hypothetical protein